MKSLLTALFQAFVPTALTPLGQKLFYITNENDHIARLTRIRQLYRIELDSSRATFEKA